MPGCRQWRDDPPAAGGARNDIEARITPWRPDSLEADRGTPQTPSTG
jgi:hypothetical protein